MQLLRSMFGLLHDWSVGWFPAHCRDPRERPTTLAVSWNCRKRVTEAYTLRPHATAATMGANELSRSRMSAASLQR